MKSKKLKVIEIPSTCEIDDIVDSLLFISNFRMNLEDREQEKENLIDRLDVNKIIYNKKELSNLFESCFQGNISKRVELIEFLKENVLEGGN